jgi:hypothetical protein
MWRIAGLIVPMVVLVGCATERSWVYTPNHYANSNASSNNKIVVLPFNDARQNENSNHILMYAIPLMPFGWADFEVPEGVQQHITSGLWVNYKPTEDYPKALAEELRSAHLFKDAYFDFKAGDADLVIRGTLRSTKYSGKIYSYGLSLYGPLFWFFGLPAGSAQNDLSVELSCDDAKSGRTLVTREYRAPTYSATSFLYVMANDFDYPELLADVYKRFTDDLAHALP